MKPTTTKQAILSRRIQFLSLLKFSLPSLFFLTLFNGTIFAQTTHTVCASGCDFTTIQAAIDDAGTVNGDIISLTDPVYTATNITVTKNLTIRGAGMDNTIVQAAASPNSGAGRVFDIQSAATVEDMTVRHGDTGSPGAGFFVSSAVLLNLSGVKATLNRVTGGSDGGAVSLHAGGSSLNATNCVFSENHAGDWSGGIFKLFNPGSVTLTSCLIDNNTSHDRGTGVGINEGTLTMTNCTVSNNNNLSAATGGGVYVRFGSHQIINSTIVNNNATGSNAGGGLFVDHSTVHLTNNIIANNTANGSTPADIRTNNGNISTNNNNLVQSCSGSCPSFSYSSDPNLGPLTSCGPNQSSYYPVMSPSDAIDNGTTSGAPATDQCGNARDASPNIGASEATELPAPVPTMGEWALIIFGLIIAIMGTVTLMNFQKTTRKLALSNSK